MIHRNNLKLCICILHMYTCTSNYRTLFRLLFCRSNKLFGRHLDHQSLILSFLSSFLISDLNFSFAKLFENLPFSYQPPNNLRMRESKLFLFTNLSVPETGLLLSRQNIQQTRTRADTRTAKTRRPEPDPTVNYLTRPDTKWVTKFPGPQPEFYPKNASILQF